jgi:hypothetical protein
VPVARRCALEGRCAARVHAQPERCAAEADVSDVRPNVGRQSRVHHSHLVHEAERARKRGRWSRRAVPQRRPTVRAAHIGWRPLCALRASASGTSADVETRGTAPACSLAFRASFAQTRFGRTRSVGALT